MLISKPVFNNASSFSKIIPDPMIEKVVLNNAILGGDPNVFILDT